jgi:hypothetical protein
MDDDEHPQGRVWHPEHFCCAHCHAPFAGSQFYEKNGLPYCEEHYKQLFGRPCSKCDLVRAIPRGSSLPHAQGQTGDGGGYL